jgi:outer membrane protein assembly factor BamB
MKQRAWIAVLIGLAIAGAGYLLFLTVYLKPVTAPVIDSTEPVASGLEETPPAEEELPPPLPLEGPPDSGEWNTYHGDGALLGVTDSEFRPPFEVHWRLRAGGPVRQTPVVHDGRVFIATARGELLCADLNGNLIWSRELIKGETPDGNPLRHRIDAPIACFDGLLLAGTGDGSLYALDPATGEDRWIYKLDGAILGTPNYLGADADHPNGRVFVLEQSVGLLVCLDAATGNEIWRAEEVDRSDASMAVSPGAIVFGSCAAALHVFDPATGKRLRDIEIDPDSQVAGGVALTGSRVISGSRSGKILEADFLTGETIWVYEASDDEIFATPAVTADWVIAASYDGFIYALDRKTGGLRWKFDTEGLPGSAVIAGDNVIAVADGQLFMLRLSDGTSLWSMVLSDEITSPAVTQRHILVGSEDGVVIALVSGDGEES